MRLNVEMMGSEPRFGDGNGNFFELLEVVFSSHVHHDVPVRIANLPDDWEVCDVNLNPWKQDGGEWVHDLTKEQVNFAVDASPGISVTFSFLFVKGLAEHRDTSGRLNAAALADAGPRIRMVDPTIRITRPV